MPPHDVTPLANPAEGLIARGFLDITHAALSDIAPDGLPGVSRIAIGRDAIRTPLTLISALAPHYSGLRAH